ncbi:MAG: LysR substrate-binding domain-containing protein, partial [Yoonia sp.]
KDRFPALGIHIRPGLTETLLADISRGSVDAAIVTRPHLLPADIAFKDLAREPLQLIAHAQDPLDDPIALLHSRPFIRFNRRAVLGTLIENWLVANKVRVTEAMELDSPEAITSMVQANLGVSIVPDLVVKPLEQVAVKRIALGTDAPTRLLGLAYRKDHIKTRLLDEVFATLSDVIAEAT